MVADTKNYFFIQNVSRDRCPQKLLLYKNGAVTLTNEKPLKWLPRLRDTYMKLSILLPDRSGIMVQKIFYLQKH